MVHMRAEHGFPGGFGQPSIRTCAQYHIYRSVRVVEQLGCRIGCGGFTLRGRRHCGQAIAPCVSGGEPV